MARARSVRRCGRICTAIELARWAPASSVSDRRLAHCRAAARARLCGHRKRLWRKRGCASLGAGLRGTRSRQRDTPLAPHREKTALKTKDTMHMPGRQTAAFSLIELVVALAIVA